METVQIARCRVCLHCVSAVAGLHIYHKPEGEIRELAKMIKDTGIGYVYTGHCTGGKAYRILKEELGSVAHQFRVGLEMEF